MRTFTRALIVAAALGVTATAHATSDDTNGYTEIARGDYAAAEKLLTQEMKQFPADADLAINLAAVYVHQGRLSEARALYNDVMSRPNDLLDLAADKSMWSHDLAAAGLARIGRFQVTAR